MWDLFVLGVLAGTIILFVPGILILKSCRYSWVTSICTAPIITILAYEALSIAYDKLGIWASGWSLFWPVMIFSLICLVALSLHRKIREKRSLVALCGIKNPGTWLTQRRFNICSIVLYIVVGFVIGIVVFLVPLESPEAVSVTYDDMLHYGVLRNFVDTGIYSTLNTGVYIDVNPSGGSYYPAAWHMFSAMITSITGASIAIASNAANFVLSCIAFPLSVLFLLKQVFPENKRAIIAGSFVSLGFMAFPWYFLIYGRLVSNLMGFVYVPCLVGLAIVALNPREQKQLRIRFFVLAILGCITAVLAQPNAFFTVVYFVAPYCIYLIWTHPKLEEKTAKQKLGRVAVFCIIVLILWLIAYRLPFLRSVIQFNWPGHWTVPTSFLKVLFAASFPTPYSIIMGVLIIIGSVCAVRNRKYTWMFAVYAILAIVYIIDASQWGGQPKHILAGFWYTDTHRVAGMVALAGIPLAALGAGWLVKCIGKLGKSSRTNYIISGIALVAIALLIFRPGPGVFGESRSPSSYLSKEVKWIYNLNYGEDENIFSQQEREFTEKVKEITGDSKVYNAPFDGSNFAFQHMGVNANYREYYVDPGRNEYEKILQSSLNEYASNKEVQEAVAALGIEYVMLLDYAHDPATPDWWPGYEEGYGKYWEGVEGIRDDTPGFELVLADNDMRLYKLVPMEDL